MISNGVHAPRLSIRDSADSAHYCRTGGPLPRCGRHADRLRPVGLGIGQPGQVAERVRVRELDDDEGKRLVRITRRGTGSVVTW